MCCRLFYSSSFVIVAQKAEFRHFLAQSAEQAYHVFTVNVSGKIEVEQVFKILALCGARLDFCQVQPKRVKAAKQIIQRALNMGK